MRRVPKKLYRVYNIFYLLKKEGKCYKKYPQYSEIISFINEFIYLKKLLLKGYEIC